MIAELDAEVPVTGEQIAIETAIVDAEKNKYEEDEPEHGKNGYCRKCHSYCYGDCEAN